MRIAFLLCFVFAVFADAKAQSLSTADYQEILAEHLEAATNGDLQATLMVSIAYTNLGKPSSASNLLRSGVILESSRANLMLGALLLDRPELEIELYEAHKYLRAAREMGEQEANLLLGYLYDQTDRFPFSHQIFKSKLAAFKAYERAATSGEPRAHIALARAYIEGRIVDRDMYKSRDHAETAARSGSAPAQYLAGLMYVGVEGLPADMVSAVYWLCSSAKSGFGPAVEIVEGEVDCGVPIRPTKTSTSLERRPAEGSAEAPAHGVTKGREDFFSMFLGAFFSTLGEVAVYKLTGIAPANPYVLTPSDSRDIAEAARQGQRQAIRKQERMRKVFENLKLPADIGQ